MAGALPDSNPELMLVAARLRHISATKWGTKKDLDMDRPREMEFQQEAGGGGFVPASRAQYGPKRLRLLATGH